MITIDEIKAMEDEKQRVRAELAKIGRAIYAIRHGEELAEGFRFSSYLLNTFDGTHYCGMDDEDWEIGTSIFSITFYSSGWQQSRSITFPSAWLTQDYKALETELVAALKEVERAAAEEQEKAAAIAREERDRREFERLKEKFA